MPDDSQRELVLEKRPACFDQVAADARRRAMAAAFLRIAERMQAKGDRETARAVVNAARDLVGRAK